MTVTCYLKKLAQRFVVVCILVLSAVDCGQPLAAQLHPAGQADNPYSASPKPIVLPAENYYAVPPTNSQVNEQPNLTPSGTPTRNQDAQGDQEAASDDEARAKAQAALQKKASAAYKPLFFDNDFSYLCDPMYQGWQLGERLKKRTGLLGIGCLDLGGQYRVRGQFERNFRGLGLTGVDDDFLLHRTRLYADWRVSPDIRVYAEMIDADSNYENFPPRPIEVNRTDLLNGFVDGRLLADGRGELILRVGRQELLYGVQRVVSPLDWANTRRTFDGVKLGWSGRDWDVDAFWTHPVLPDDRTFDSPDRDQEFMGIWSTYQARQDHVTDIYFLRYLNGRGTNNFKYDTWGVRSQGKRCGWLWEIQAAAQFGQNSDGSDHAAGMATIGLGKNFENAHGSPTAWLFYDWASGDNDLGAGHGYDHLFPLAHKYLGFMDLFGRRNIEDLNLLITAQPAERIDLLFWYHFMYLATQSDSPYSVVMTPLNGTNLPGSPNLGQEIDLLARIKITPRQNLVLGYSHFFSGRYYQTTTGVPFSGDADFFYTQYTINF